MNVNYFMQRINNSEIGFPEFVFKFYDINSNLMFMTNKSYYIKEYRNYVGSSMRAEPITPLTLCNVLDFYINGNSARIYTDFDAGMPIYNNVY